MSFDPKKDVFGFLKTTIDIHTLGIKSISELLKDCGFRSVLSDDRISKAFEEIERPGNFEIIADWIRSNGITRVGISYRLDPDESVHYFGKFFYQIRQHQMLSVQGGPLRSVYFAGLPSACDIIQKEYGGFVNVFKGNETHFETLAILGIPEIYFPAAIVAGNEYDKLRTNVGADIVRSEEYRKVKAADRSKYKEYGTDKDSLVKRLSYVNQNKQHPLIRAHVGPYHPDRRKSIDLFLDWLKKLREAGFLDIVSIGTSQLTQSKFMEDWSGRPNGGGVQINSVEEFRQVWEQARPMLVRTYAGTKNIPQLAQIYEEQINIAWHALSFWWFNQLDGRGPYSLYENLKQHVETLRYIARTDKPFEANVPHHFSFRGGDDLTYIVSAYLSAKMAKKCGIRHFVLQNMLNTPRSTWGVQDLAKSRAMLHLVRTLENDHFKVILQPRAGLDYFSPDQEQAKIQLSSVTALMDDIEPRDGQSPPMIHVVSYSEGNHLATPDIINESIQITLHTLKTYRQLRKSGDIPDMASHTDVQTRYQDLLNGAKAIIQSIESSIENPYSPEGFYQIFAAGYLPTPYLWHGVEQFPHAVEWKTKFVNGGIRVVDDNGHIVPPAYFAEIASEHAKRLKRELKSPL